MFDDFFKAAKKNFPNTIPRIIIFIMNRFAFVRMCCPCAETKNGSFRYRFCKFAKNPKKFRSLVYFYPSSTVPGNYISNHIGIVYDYIWVHVCVAPRIVVCLSHHQKQATYVSWHYYYHHQHVQLIILLLLLTLLLSLLDGFGIPTNISKLNWQDLRWWLGSLYCITITIMKLLVLLLL